MKSWLVVVSLVNTCLGLVTAYLLATKYTSELTSLGKSHAPGNDPTPTGLGSSEGADDGPAGRGGDRRPRGDA